MDLICARHILWTHEDYDLMLSLSVGFDEEKNLVIKLRHDDGAEPWRTYDECYFVTFADAFVLARRCHCRLTELPAYFDSRFGETRSWRIGMADYEEVRETLHALLDLIHDKGVRYSFKRVCKHVKR